MKVLIIDAIDKFYDLTMSFDIAPADRLFSSIFVNQLSLPTEYFHVIIRPYFFTLKPCYSSSARKCVQDNKQIKAPDTCTLAHVTSSSLTLISSICVHLHTFIHNVFILKAINRFQQTFLNNISQLLLYGCMAN